jgi:hypothetical protein
LLPYIEPTFFRVFPNPTSGKLTIELLGIDAAKPVSIEIYSAMGEKITTAHLTGNLKYELTLAERPAGLYFIRLVSGDYSNTQKIILSE